MSDTNVALLTELSKVLGDTFGGRLAKTIRDLLLAERVKEQERILKVLKEAGYCVPDIKKLIKGEQK